MSEQGQCGLLLLVRHPGRRHPWTVCQSPELELCQAGPPTGPQRPSRTLGKAFPGALASDPGPPSFSGGPALWSPSSHCSQEAFLPTARWTVSAYAPGASSEVTSANLSSRALPRAHSPRTWPGPSTLTHSRVHSSHSALTCVTTLGWTWCRDTAMSPHPTEDYVQDQGSDSSECPSPLSGA